MAKKKINASDFVKKIEVLTKTRMASQDVVPLADYRGLKKKIEPKVVLVIEDDESMRAALKKIIETDGLIVKLAADGTELSQVLDHATPDLVILDIGLPWINGFELGQMMKEHKELKKIPLIFLSGKSSEEDIKKAFEVGADEFIKKPFDIDKLKKTVNKFLKIN